MLPFARVGFVCLFAGTVFGVGSGLAQAPATDKAPEKVAEKAPEGTAKPSQAEGVAGVDAGGAKSTDGAAKSVGKVDGVAPADGSKVAAVEDPSKISDPVLRAKAQLALDTARLFQLANELKAEMDKSTKDTLSLTVMKKADEIERLAKKVREEMQTTIGN